MFRFGSPEFFQYLMFVPIALVIIFFFSKNRQKKLHQAVSSRLYPFLTQSISMPRRRIKLALQIAVLILLVFALARPQFGASEQKIKSAGVEIFFAVDVSESMMAEDVKPNRLEQAKAELSKLVDRLPGNKMGVIAFAGSAALLSPLTNDPAAVKMYLESLSPNSVSTQGTSFTEALSLSDKAFKRGGAQVDEVNRVARVILLVSDGEDHEAPAEELAEQLVKEGTRIFGLAYGTEKGAGIPVRDGMGFLKGYKKDQSGNTVLSKVNGDAISSLVQKGQGSFFFASFGGRHLDDLISDLERLEKTEFENAVATQYDEKFQTLLWAALILGLLELILGERRSQFSIWRGRFEVPS